MNKIIVVDADVVSHFIYAGEILSLPKIFPIPIKVLDKVYDELSRFPKKKQAIENLINFNLLQIIPFPENNAIILKEYLYIRKVLFKGDGESACMAFARFTKNILASSNLKDIRPYCEMHKVKYLTTMDFLCYALKNNIFTLERCNKFIENVLISGNKLPVRRMEEFNCSPLLNSI